jgi:hypothetical protein
MAQSGNKSDRLRPQWMTKQLPNPKSAGYIFVKAEGSGSSLEAARQACLVELANYLETERGLEINSHLQQQSSMTTTQNYNERSGKEAEMAYDFTQTDKFNMEVIEKGRKINMVCRTIDEYWVKNGGVYMVTTLYTVADQNTYGGSYYDDISTVNSVNCNYNSLGTFVLDTINRDMVIDISIVKNSEYYLHSSVSNISY